MPTLLDAVQELRDERELYEGTTKDERVERDCQHNETSLFNLRQESQEHFSGEDYFNQLRRDFNVSDVRCFLVLGEMVVAYGRDIGEVNKMARNLGYDPCDCLTLFPPEEEPAIR